MKPLPFYTKVLLALNFLLFISSRVNAQIKPDSTLGNENTTISPIQVIKGVSSDVISGGTVRGKNLFHSFENFSINSGQGAYFINPTGIANILTRITGKNPSNILGVLGVLGNANLFFLNPNGILFGPNARLELNGSFLATTASSFNFLDGSNFSARNPQSVPLLTISVPIGLRFDAAPGPINVQGYGNTLDTSQLLSPVIGAGQSLTGLRLNSGKSLALIGGEVIFQGGVVTVPSGQIKIGSVEAGQVKINSFPQGWSIDYEGVNSFQDISMSRLSLADASGAGSGDIQLAARNINLSDGSYVLIQNQGTLPAGNINVNASESLTVTGTTPDPFSRGGSKSATRSGLLSQTFFGEGANVHVSTQRLYLVDGGGIVVDTFGSGAGGNSNITASESIQGSGYSTLDPLFGLSGIATDSFGAGAAGNINLSTKHLSLLKGALIVSTAYSSGTGGDPVVNSTESVDIIGTDPFNLLPSVLSTSTLGQGERTLSIKRLSSQ